MLLLNYQQGTAKQPLTCIHCQKAAKWAKMQCPRHCIPTGDLGWSEMFCTINFPSGVLDDNQGEHTMQKVNKRQLSQNRLCPSLAVLSRSRSETSSQVLRFTLSQTLLLAHWGWIFASAQVLCWLPNVACCLLWESQWMLLVRSFLLTPFSDDTAIPASQVDAASSVPSLSAELCVSNSLSQDLAQSPWAFASAVPVGSAQSLWHPWFPQLGSGLPHKALLIQEFPSMQGSCISTKGGAGVHVNWGEGDSPWCLSSLSRE